MSTHMRFSAGSDRLTVSITGPGWEEIADGVREIFAPYAGQTTRRSMTDARDAIEQYLTELGCLLSIDSHTRRLNPGGVGLFERHSIVAMTPILTEPFAEDAK